MSPYRESAMPPERVTRRTLWGRLRSAWRRFVVWEAQPDDLPKELLFAWREIERAERLARRGMKRRDGTPYKRMWTYAWPPKVMR